MKVSITIPVYNVELYIADCLQSVMRQTYQGSMECILVDDCGSDKSMAIAEHLISEYKGPIVFRIVHHERNRGLAAARNTALEHVTGEFVCHVDSDDWLENDAIENLVRVQQETEADIVSGNAIAHYSDRVEELIEPNYVDKNEMIRQSLQLTLDHVIWRRLIRTALYRDNGITAVEGVNIGEDHYTLPRLLYFANSFAKCNKVLYHYNCTNDHSYMQSTGDSFNRTRYTSNIASINILIDFFAKNSADYMDELYAIKTKYVYKNFFIVLKLGEKDAYNELCSDWKSIDDSYKKAEGLTTYRIGLLSSSKYSLNRIRVLSRIIVKKIFGIRCYNL